MMGKRQKYTSWWQTVFCTAALATALAGAAPASYAAPTLALLHPIDRESQFTVIHDASGYHSMPTQSRESDTDVLYDLLQTELPGQPKFDLVQENEDAQTDGLQLKLETGYDWGGFNVIFEYAAQSMDTSQLADLWITFTDPGTHGNVVHGVMTQLDVGEAIDPALLADLKRHYPARYFLLPAFYEMEARKGARSSDFFSYDNKVKAEATVLCQLIDGETGTILWREPVKGHGKNTGLAVNVGGGKGQATVGTEVQIHEGLYTAALEDVTQNIVEELKKVMASLPE